LVINIQLIQDARSEKHQVIPALFGHSSAHHAVSRFGPRQRNGLMLPIYWILQYFLWSLPWCCQCVETSGMSFEV